MASNTLWHMQLLQFARLWWMLLAVSLLPSFAPAFAQFGADPNRWSHYGGDAGNTKYSPLDQIDRGSLPRLEIAWRWSSPDNGLPYTNHAFEATPLYIDGVLYTSTSFSQAAAIDARTGTTLWVFDPESYRSGRPPNQGFLHRGVAYWENGDATTRRILYATGDARLISLDALTGEPDGRFGSGGTVDLRAGIPRSQLAGYGATSPPLVVGDRVIVGSSIHDGDNGPSAPPGDVRAFDVRTGALLWTFHTVPRRGELGYDTWLDGSANDAGHTNVWAPMSADLDRELIYLPVSAPTNHYYGGARLGSNLFANSLVCLDARTGRRKWHFQIVHHDIWDYDLAAAPNLMDVRVGGRNVPAVVQPTKQGLLFVFHRVTGQPLWPIEERPVPASTVPGEVASPTQPFPTHPPAFSRLGVQVEELVDGSAAERQAAIDSLAPYDWGSLYTPPSQRGTILFPGIGGGANWGGAAFDPETGRLYVTPLGAVPFLIRIGPSGAGWAANEVRIFEGPFGFYLFKPPRGRIVAYNMRTGQIAWDRANNAGLGVAGHSNALVTKSLLFYGSASESRLQVFDKGSGQRLRAIGLPARASGAPMTYKVDGRQYVVVAVGQGNEMMELVALSLEGPIETTPGSFRFERLESIVPESAGEVELIVLREGGQDGDVSVRIDAVDGSAIRGEDYRFDRQRLEWTDGDSKPKSVLLQIVDDETEDENDETLELVLSDPEGGASLGGESRHLVTLDDNDYGPCEVSESTQCFGQDRFRVEAAFSTSPQGPSGQARARPLTADSGYFVFFDDQNVEVVVKVLDACRDFGSYWVFAAGLTNVGVELTVIDTVADRRKVYVNRLGQPFEPIVDTVAFATCE